MIKINLANKSMSTASSEVVMNVTGQGEVSFSKEEFQKQAMLRVMIMFLVPFGVYAYEEYSLMPELKARQANLQKEQAELAVYNEKREPAVREIKKYGEEKEKIEKKIQFLNNLAKQRSRELTLHKFFQNNTPPKMWLKSYDYDQPGNKINLVGRTLDRSEINLFRSAILGNIMFKSAEIAKQNNTTDAGEAAVEFEISILLENPDESATQ